MGLELVDLCREKGIILFCLPPHTTHALQPLDVSVFKSLKDHYSKSVRSLTLARKNFVVTKREFARIIKSPFERAFSIPNIKAGFAKCGVYPFNRNAVPIMKMMPSSLHDSPLNFSSSDSSSDLAAPSSSSSTSVSASPHQLHDHLYLAGFLHRHLYPTLPCQLHDYFCLTRQLHDNFCVARQLHSRLYLTCLLHDHLCFTSLGITCLFS